MKIAGAVLAVALAFGLEGCRTAAPSLDRIVCVAENVSVGARLPLNISSPMGRWTEPEPYVITSLHGRSRHCPTDQRPITARAVPASVDAELVAKSREPKREFSSLAKVEAGDVFPAGALLLARHTFRKVGSEEGAAWLVVNFGATNAKGERSYVADTIAHCKSGALSVAWWTTYGQPDGTGDSISSQTHSPNLKIEKPSPAIASAARAICSLTGEKP